MRILFVTEYFAPRTKGGGEQSCLELAQALATDGAHITVLTSHGEEGPSIEQRKNLEIKRLFKTGENPAKVTSTLYRSLFLGRNIRNAIRQTLKEDSFDVIHYFNTTSTLGMVNTSIPQLIHINSPVFFCPKGTLICHKGSACQHKGFLPFVRCLLARPDIGKMGAHWYITYNPLSWFALYLSWKLRVSKLSRAQLLVAVSKFMARQCRRFVRTPTVIVPNIVRKVSHGKKTPSKTLRLLFLGTLVKYKGIFTLLDALRELKRPARAHFFGDGPDKPEMAAKISANKLQEKVTLHPPLPQTEIGKAFSNADVLVFPSIVPESFGRTIVEGYSTGTPAIITSIGGQQELADPKTAVLFSPGNAHQLTRILERIETTSFSPQKMHDIHARHSPKAIAQTMRAHYEKIINQNTIPK